MEMEYYIFKTEGITKVSGKMIKWMDLGDFIMKMDK